jgi:hypothetical protein
MYLGRRGNTRLVLRWLLLITLAVLGSRPGAASAQDEDDVLARIQRAFVQGDSRQLLEGAAEQIEVSLFGTSTLFSRSQAVYVLESFFRQYPPRRCVFERPVEASEGSFTAGQCWYRSSETPLRVYVGLRRKGDLWELRELRVDEQRQE